jgi:hypothetical protein
MPERSASFKPRRVCNIGEFDAAQAYQALPGRQPGGMIRPYSD